MLEFSGLNYGAVLLTIVINMGLGGFWYSPVGFGKLWSKLSHIDIMKMPKKDANRALGVTAITAVVQCLMLAVIINSLKSMTLARGFEIGLVLWAGFTAATTVSDTLYARRGWRFWWLNSSYYLIVILVNAVILSVWR